MNRHRVLAAAGLLAVVLSAIVPGTSIEAVLGRVSGSLTWGPALFRLLLAFHGIALMILARKTGGLTLRIPNEMPWKPLLALTAIAFALRTIRLDTCFWMDEIFALTESIRAPIGTVVSSFPTQNQHMLYSLLARLSLGAFGESEWAARLPAVFFGVACVWPLFLLGRSLIGTREALLASTLMTVSYHGVWFSQNARGYTGLLFFTMLATWVWIEASREGGRAWWIWYALIGAAGLWTHLTMAFVIATHALVELVRFVRGKGSWPALASIGLAGTLALQLYSLSLPEFLRTGLGEVSLPSQWTDPLWAAAEAVRSLRVAFSGLAVLAVGGFVAVVGWMSILRRSPSAALSFILPGIVSGAAMIALGHNLWPRFFFFCMGFALLIAIHGVFRVPALLRLPDRWTKRLGLGGAYLLIAASAITLPLCYRYPKQDFTGARDYIESRRQPGEIVTAAGLAAPAYRYYSPSWNEAQSDEAFEAISERTQWLVYTLPPYLQAWQPRTWASILQQFETVRAFPGTLGEGTVFVCRRRARQ